jgi:hypothetical protein
MHVFLLPVSLFNTLHAAQNIACTAALVVGTEAFIRYDCCNMAAGIF